MYHHVRTKLQIPFRFIEPNFFSGLLDDPLLLLRNRPDGSNLLFDCGQVHHLAKRVLKAIDNIFISHAHMDHFMGMANFARNILVSTKTVNVYGPTGLSSRLAHLLAGFDWNLCEKFWCSFRVLEIGHDHIQTYMLSGPEGFKCQQQEAYPIHGDVIYSNNHVRVSARGCNHKIPSLIYRIDEQPAFIIDENKLLKAGLARGDWLRELNSRYNRGELDQGPIAALSTDYKEVHFKDAADLYQSICSEQTPLSVGYLTDIGWTEENRSAINSLLNGVNMLISECTYARADIDKAKASFHLCTDDLNELMADLQPDYVMPVHISKSYLSETDRINAELRPPAGTRILRLPDHIVPRPFLPDEIPGPDII